MIADCGLTEKMGTDSNYYDDRGKMGTDSNYLYNRRLSQTYGVIRVCPHFSVSILPNLNFGHSCLFRISNFGFGSFGIEESFGE